MRIVFERLKFGKSYLQGWTDEIFQTSFVYNTVPKTYKIDDLEGKEIKGTFYSNEVRVGEKTVCMIEKIIKMRNRGKKLLFKWLVRPSFFNLDFEKPTYKV